MAQQDQRYQWVEDPALPQLPLGLQRWLRSDHQPRSSMCRRVARKKPKNTHKSESRVMTTDSTEAKRIIKEDSTPPNLITQMKGPTP